MCTAVIKYLPEYGWVGCKNRDRNYKPNIVIKQSFKDDVESLYLYDLNTKYSEGVNQYGVSILNTATAVKNDESEAAIARHKADGQAKRAGFFKAPDGVKIRKALKFKTPKEAAEFLAEQRLVGNTFVFNEEHCFLLEGGRDKKQFDDSMAKTKENPEYEWPEMKYVYTIREIPKSETAIRTNTGHFLPWLGYQKDSEDAKQMMSRKSSDERFKYATINTKDSKSPWELVEDLAKLDDKNSQLNPLRVGDYHKKNVMKTTGQICLIPKKREMIYVPIWCNIDLSNFGKLNSHKTETFLTVKPRNVLEESAVDYLGNLLLA